MSNSQNSNLKLNRLAQEKSPYLKQHQSNPVDWFPWGDEAFDRAKRDQKPIFLSIGYSTCHWCHVMERESFEDPFVATLLNQSFVNIKVDREERPDIDHIYMTVCQMMTGHGGWPLTIIMTPDQKPFFAGTYIPKTTKHGHLGLVDLIPRVQDLWVNSQDKVNGSAENILEALNRAKDLHSEAGLSGELLHHGYEFHKQSYDETWGGFGDHPKFPSLHHLQFLFRYGDRFKTDQPKQMAIETLRQIISGGIYDHVGGGIHRYSVDREWFVPHFEKMLYDQAMLISVLTEAIQVSGDQSYLNTFKQTVEETIAYLRRDLLAPEGAFYAGEDADSEGEEGKFYLWEREDFRKHLGGRSEIFENLFELKEPGNFSEHGQQRVGNILRFVPDTMDKWTTQPDWTQVREKLRVIRSERVRPSRDNKILLDWNGMLVAALAFAGRVFNRQDWIQLAEDTVASLEKILISEENLLHSYCDEEAKFKGNLDDYAYMLQAYVELYQSTLNPIYLIGSQNIAGKIVEKFWDEKEKGFFFTPNDGEKLIVRKKEYYDGAYPSGNSVICLNFAKLSKLLGDSKWEELATQTLQKLSGNLDHTPGGFTYALCALDFVFGPTREIVLVGSDDSAKRSIQEIKKKPLYRDVYHWIREGESRVEYQKAAPFLLELKQLSDETTLYICENFSCKSPKTVTQELIDRL